MGKDNLIVFRHLGLDEDNLRELCEKYKKDWKPIYSDSGVFEIKDSDNQVWSLEYCLNQLSKKLEFGDIEQIRSLRALEIFNAIYQLSDLSDSKDTPYFIEGLKKFNNVEFEYG